MIEKSKMKSKVKIWYIRYLKRAMGYMNLSLSNM